jgi:IS30 family transposase
MSTEPKARPPLTTGEVDRIIAAYEAGASVRAIAASIGRSYGCIWRVLDRAGVEMRPKGRRKAAT